MSSFHLRPSSKHTFELATDSPVAMPCRPAAQLPPPDVLATLFKALAASAEALPCVELQRCAMVCRSWRSAALATVGYCRGAMEGSEADGRRACVEALAFIPAYRPPASGLVDLPSQQPAALELPAGLALPPALRTATEGWAASVVAGSTDGSGHLWGAESQAWTGEVPRPPPVFMGGAVYALAYLPTQRWLAAGSFDASIKLWDLESQLEVGVLRGHTSWINALAHLPEWDWLASGSADTTVLLHDPATRTIVGVFGGHHEPIHAVALLPRSRWLASGSADGTVKLFQIPAPSEIETLRSAGIETSEETGEERWSASALQPQSCASLAGHSSTVRAVVAISSFCSDIVASGSKDGTVRIWEPGTQAELVKVVPADAPKSVVYALAWVANSRILAVGGSGQPREDPNSLLDGTVRLYKLDETSRCDGRTAGVSVSPVATLHAHSGWVTSLACIDTPHGTLASGSHDCSIKLWTV